MPQFFMLQKRPDGESAWDDNEGRSYEYSQKLPGAKALCKSDVVLFYRPVKSGTPEDGCIFATAIIAVVEQGGNGLVVAKLKDYVALQQPVPLKDVGDPRANSQHSFQQVNRAFFESVLKLSGGREDGTA